MYDPDTGKMKPITEKEFDEVIEKGGKGVFRVGEAYECNGAKLKCIGIYANELRFKTVKR